MKALTLWQPWASIVASGIKRIENRPWAPPGWILGQTIAIHASARWDKAADLLAGDLVTDAEIPLIPCRRSAPHMAIIATARVIAVALSADEAVRSCDGDETQRRWFFGPIGWVLDEITAVEPIPCRGFQKLWNVPPDIAEMIA